MLKSFSPNCAQLISLSCSRMTFGFLEQGKKSQRDGTGTRVKTRLHIIMGGLFLPLIGVGEVSDTSGMSQPSLPFKLSFSYFMGIPSLTLQWISKIQMLQRLTFVPVNICIHNFVPQVIHIYVCRRTNHERSLPC